MRDGLSRADDAVSPTELRLTDDAGRWDPHLNPNLSGDRIKAALEGVKGAERAEEETARQQEQARNQLDG